MKNILFSIVLALSLIVGSTTAFADMTTQKNVEGRGAMKAQEVPKGLDEPIVIASGEETWILHQPANHEVQYFVSNDDQKFTEDSSDDNDSPQG